jgi:hypothetical protein
LLEEPPELQRQLQVPLQLAEERLAELLLLAQEQQREVWARQVLHQQPQEA